MGGRLPVIIIIPREFGLHRCGFSSGTVATHEISVVCCWDGICVEWPTLQVSCIVVGVAICSCVDALWHLEYSFFVWTC